MREALDKINKEEKKQRVERESRSDADRIKSLGASTEAVKGKSVTSLKTAKERYDAYMKENAPKLSKTGATITAGAMGGPMGMGIGVLKTIASYMKAGSLSKDQAIQDLIDKGVSAEEASSVVSAAIRGNPDIERSQAGSSGRGGGADRRERNAEAATIDDVVNVMQGGEPSATDRYSPVYQEGSGYGNLYNPQGAPQQAGMQGNQIVAASQQPLTEFGGYGAMSNNVVPTNAEQFSQTPTSDQQNNPEFWDIAEKLVMEGS